MKCLISKLIIDSREDSGKKFPGFVSEHLKKCSGCRAYENLGRQLSSVNPYDVISDQSMTDLNRKISANIYNDKPGESKRSIRLFSPIPIAATFFIIIISLGVILFQGINKSSENGGGKPLINVAAAGNIKNINDLFTQVESPIRREAEELKRTVNSAGEYLKSVMDFGLPGIPD